MNTVTSRKDFMSKILENKEAQGVTTDEMQAHASVMVLAGSETIATSLSAITYYLCRNPEVYKKLTTEIREAFSNYDDIKGQPTEKLSYLKAVIEEELRIFPAVPFGMPRYSPGETVDGYFIPKGVSLVPSPSLQVCMYVLKQVLNTGDRVHNVLRFNPRPSEFPPSLRVPSRALARPKLQRHQRRQPTVSARLTLLHRSEVGPPPFIHLDVADIS